MVIRPLRIVHLSDLHIGLGFENNMWENLRQIVIKNQPHLIIVSGDFVNNPLCWTLRSAKKKIEQLVADVNKAAQAKQAKHRCILIAVPGNHDVRLSGLIPISWVMWGWGLFAIALTSVHTLLGLELLSFTYGSCIALGALLGVCAGSFRQCFAQYILDDRPVLFGDLGLLVYSFDSASRGISAARGSISNKQFVMANISAVEISSYSDDQVADHNQQPPYAIAVVHHHPLPIPYENPQEPLMILDNAGAFLNEVSRRGVRLILHGHRHRRNCARISVNVGTHKEHEVAVLSAGSATASADAGRLGFSFNALCLDTLGRMYVTPYEATKGGTFKELDPFTVESQELTAKRTYLETSRANCRSSQLIASLTEISPDGDVYKRIERHGLQVIGENASLDKLGPITAETKTGHIELFEAGCLDKSCFGLKLDLQGESKDNCQKAVIDIGKIITQEHHSINYFYHYFGLNTIAMSAQQYREMYNTEEAPIEDEWITLSGTPAAELLMVIKLPRDLQIEGDPELVITDQQTVPQYQLENELQGKLAYYKKPNLIIFRVDHPPVGMKYTVRWRLTDDAPPFGRSANSRSGKVEELGKLLLGLPVPTPQEHPLRELLSAIEDQIRIAFQLGPREKEPIDISVMAYELNSRTLKLVCGNFKQQDDSNWIATLKYGDGIAGRAYKMNKPRLFVKALASQKRTPAYYRRRDGKPVSVKDVPAEVIISIPLNHKDDGDIIYGVLNISSPLASSKLVDLKEESLHLKTVALFQGINKACFEAFERLY